MSPLGVVYWEFPQTLCIFRVKEEFNKPPWSKNQKRVFFHFNTWGQTFIQPRGSKFTIIQPYSLQNSRNLGRNNPLGILLLIRCLESPELRNLWKKSFFWVIERVANNWRLSWSLKAILKRLTFEFHAPVEGQFISVDWRDVQAKVVGVLDSE